MSDKTCSKCGKTKPATKEYFHRRKDGRDGLRADCKVCNNTLSRIYRKKNKIKEKNHQLLRLYGITVDDFYLKLFKQRMRCEICEKYLDGEKNTHLDHNHKTGKIRGILCMNCNIVIGHVKDNIDILNKAIWYLNKHG